MLLDLLRPRLRLVDFSRFLLFFFLSPELLPLLESPSESLPLDELPLVDFSALSGSSPNP